MLWLARRLHGAQAARSAPVSLALFRLPFARLFDVAVVTLIFTALS